jgi:hypothetical protein
MGFLVDGELFSWEVTKKHAKEEDKIVFAKEIVNEFQEVGFLRLVDIPDFEDSELLESIKYYYGRSKEEKMKLALKMI